jgi:hypothetical protein
VLKKNKPIGIAVEFPADKAGDAIALLHAGAFKEPVLGFGAGPVAAAVEGDYGARADDVALVRARVFKGAEHLGIGVFLLLAELTVAGLAGKSAVGITAGVCGKRGDHVDVIGGEPKHAKAVLNGLFDVVELAQVPVFIMADADHRFDAREVVWL